MGFNGIERLVGSVYDEVEGVTVKISTIFWRPEFVWCGARFVYAFACMFSELGEELSEFLFVDVEVA